MSTTTNETIEIEAVALIFEWQFAPLYYHPDDAQQTPEGHRRAADLDDEHGPGGLWFAFYHEDCFEPPVYIIRARSWEEAYESFLEEFGQVVDEATIEDEYVEDDDRLYHTARGPVDTENVKGHELKLIAVEL